jgi:hypothetical protein
VKLSARDIDAIYYALRPRLLGLTTVAVAAPQPPAPHTHSADEITFEPALNIAGDDVQEGMEELDTENLARDGTQAMLGHLNMNGYQIYNILNLLVTGGLGSAIVSAVRVLTMAGDDDDNEARIQALERVIFNSEPTKSVIENPSRLEWNTNVTPGGHYAIETGRMSWSTRSSVPTLRSTRQPSRAMRRTWKWTTSSSTARSRCITRPSARSSLSRLPRASCCTSPRWRSHDRSPRRYRLGGAGLR